MFQDSWNILPPNKNIATIFVSSKKGGDTVETIDPDGLEYIFNM